MFIYTVLYVFFFFKQKTAYEMRISDWSSDVCSSDLPSTPTHCFGVRMATREITELQRIFQSRLDTLDHILDVGGKHLDLEAALHERLAPDMLPLGSQVALACNQPRGLSQWCGGKPVENLPWDGESVEQASAHIEQPPQPGAALDAGRAQLEQDNGTGT